MNWKWLNNLGLDEIESSTNGRLYSVSTYNDKMYSSTNNGDSWTQIGAGTDWRGLKTKGDTITVGSSDGRFFISYNGGTNFNVLKTFPSALICTEIAVIDSVTYLLAGTLSSGLFISSNQGAIWLQKSFNGKRISAVQLIGEKIFVGTYGGGFFSSEDLGITWEQHILSSADEDIWSIEKGESDSIIYVSNGNVYKSTDHGNSWSIILNATSLIFSIQYSTIENQIFAGGYMSADNGTNWRKVFPSTAQWITIKDTTIYIIDQFSGALYREEHNPYIGNNYFPLAVGNTWQLIKYDYWSSVHSVNKTYSLQYVKVTRDTILNNKNYFLIEGEHYNGFYRCDSNLFYQYSPSGDLLRMNFNLIWGDTLFNDYKIGGGYVNLFNNQHFYKSLNYSFSGPYSRAYIYYADSIGCYSLTFRHLNYPSTQEEQLIQAKIQHGDSIFIYKYNYPPPTINIDAAFLQSDSIFTLGATVSYIIDEEGTTAAGSLYFCDSLTVEYYFSNGVDSTFFYKVSMQRTDNSNLFTANIVFPDSFYHNNYTLHYKFHTKDKGLIPSYSSYPENSYLQFYIDPTGFKNINKPELSFSLSQNYPNPFNPTTTIQYAVANTQHVQLKIYDVLGNEVALLVNEEKTPGSYSVEFDASKLSSGIYFYRLQAGGFVETKKLMLLK